MLANIFLHYVLDQWFEEAVKHYVKGYCEFICYTDDARRIERGLYNRFNKYGLELHPTKSWNRSFGSYEQENAKNQIQRANTFDFLGFNHYCDRSRKGNFIIGHKTSRNKDSAKCREMNVWLKKIRNMIKTKELWKP